MAHAHCRPTIADNNGLVPPPIVIRNSRPTVPILVYWALGSGPDQSMVLLTSAATDRQDRGG